MNPRFANRIVRVLAPSGALFAFFCWSVFRILFAVMTIGLVAAKIMKIIIANVVNVHG